MKAQNIFKKVIQEIKHQPIEKKTFKELYLKESSKANFLIRQILSDINFSSITNEELIHSRIVGNHLYIISFCPEIQIKVPSVFMFDDVKKMKFSNPTIYQTSKKILEYTDVLFKQFISLEKAELLEIPISIQAYEVKKGIVFGDYKGYYNMFLVDKVLQNKIIPDELDILLLKSTLEKNGEIFEIDKKNYNDFKLKINKSWSQFNLELKVLKFKEPNYIFNQSISNLITKIEENKISLKKSA